MFEGGAVVTYRFYFLGHSDRISKRTDVECADDGEAMAKAAALKPIYGIEVWEGPRKVGLITAPVAAG